MAESKGTPRHFIQRPVDVDHLLDHLPNKSVNYVRHENLILYLLTSAV